MRLSCHALGKTPLIQQGAQLAGVGGDGVLDAGVFAEGFALDPVGVGLGLAGSWPAAR